MKKIRISKMHSKNIQEIHKTVSDIVSSINPQIYDLVMENRFDDINDFLLEHEYDIMVDVTIETVALFHKDKEISRIKYEVQNV